MNTGQIISGAGHLLIIGWALFGGVFRSDPMPFKVTEVTAISAEEYAALMEQVQNPEAVAIVDTPAPPESGDQAPGLASAADTPPDAAQPKSSEATPPDPVPDVSKVLPPDPPSVAETPPEPAVPQEDVAVMLPERSPRPQPRPSQRVAPEPVAPPEPDVRIDKVDSPEVTPEKEADVVKDPTEATAREEAATEIVTEAEKPAPAAPTASVRPKLRPAPSAPKQETAEQTTPKPEVSEPAAQQPTAQDKSAVDAALAAALAGAGGQQSSVTPSGPPLTSGEKDALRVAVQQCWNVGSLSSEALSTTVVVSVGMSEDSRPIASTIRLTSASGGGATAVDQAFEAARRAIIRCGANGFGLPMEKYDHWREIEMTFNPEKMRIK